MREFLLTLLTLACVAGATGCRMDSHAQRGTALGGVLGAGTGALIGAQTGHGLGGAAIGGIVGAIAGNAIGDGMDAEEARNRALIEAQLGRRIAPGAVTMEDVLSLTRAGVRDELVVNHIRAHGVARPLTTDELIVLSRENVSPAVVAELQNPALQPAPVAGPPVIVQEHYYGPGPYWHRPYYGPHVGWSVRVRN